MRFASTGLPAGLRSSARRRLAWRRRTARGFTLIEALAAIVILALSLSALLSAHDTGLRGVSAIDDHLRARLLAQSLLAEWSPDRIAGPSQGRSGRFAWSVAVAPYGGPRGEKGAGQWLLHEVSVTVAWAPARRIRLDTLRLLRAQ
jgi:general secretion pathway protein I